MAQRGNVNTKRSNDVTRKGGVQQNNRHCETNVTINTVTSAARARVIFSHDRLITTQRTAWQRSEPIATRQRRIFINMHQNTRFRAG